MAGDVNTVMEETLDPLIGEVVTNCIGRFQHIDLLIVELKMEDTFHSVGLKEGFQSRKHCDGLVGTRFMFLTEEWSIDGLESTTTSSFDLGDMAKALDRVTT